MTGHGRLAACSRGYFCRRVSMVAFALLCCVVFLNAAIATCTAQSINWPMPLDWQRDAELTDICAINDQHVWVVGERGLILHSMDGGQNWQQRSLVPVRNSFDQLPIQCRLESVVFISPLRGWIAGGYHNPDSTTSKGILYRTIDGGQTWTELPAGLPWIKQLFFFNEREGVAIGQGNALKPSGVYRTNDGGQSWNFESKGPIQSWQTGSYHNGTLVLAAASVTSSPLARYRSKRMLSAKLDSKSFASPRAVEMMDDHYGFAAGDHGQFLQTVDGGMSWLDSPMRNGLPEQDVDFRAMTIQGDKIWLAGDMGRRLFTLSASEKVWKAVAIPTPTPINKIAFANESTGWAIGACGDILQTNNGGAQWTLQRRGTKGVALLQVVQEPQQLVSELFARYCADQPYIGGGLVVSNFSAMKNSADQPSMDHAKSAASRVNCSFVHQYLMPQSESAADFDTNAALHRYLVRKIRTLQPRVIAIASGRVKRDQLPLRTAILAAVEDAADLSKFPELNKQLGLQPWRVGKVVIVDRGDLGRIKISANHFIPGVSALLSDYAMASRMLLNQPAIETRPISLTNIFTSPYAAGMESTLFGSIENTDAEIPRRSNKRSAAGNLVQMRQLASKRKTLDQYLEAAKSGVAAPAWSTALAELTAQLDEANAGTWLFQLAKRCEAEGHIHLSAETHLYLANKLRKHPLATASLRWLFQHFSSAEHAHVASQRRQLARASHIPDSFGKGAVVSRPGTRVEDGVNVLEWEVVEEQEQSEVSHAAWTTEQDLSFRKSRFQRARSIMQSFGIEDETALEIERNALARIGLNRKVDQMISVEDQLKQLALNDNQSAEVWRLAQLELQLLDPLRDQSNLPTGASSCVVCEERPWLDGKLDDAIWANALKKHSLIKLGNGDSANGDQVLMACDKEFLYLAIRCKRINSFGYTEELPAPRKRDEDLTRSDRIELAIDIDRDFDTYYLLSVDWMGRVADSLGNNLAWDPTWYVASARDEHSWTAEIAIPLDELTLVREGSLPRYWAISVDRRIRGEPVAASWQSSDATATESTRETNGQRNSLHEFALSGRADQCQPFLGTFQLVRLPFSGEQPKAANSRLKSDSKPSNRTPE